LAIYFDHPMAHAMEKFTSHLLRRLALYRRTPFALTPQGGFQDLRDGPIRRRL